MTVLFCKRDTVHELSSIFLSSRVKGFSSDRGSEDGGCGGVDGGALWCDVIVIVDDINTIDLIWRQLKLKISLVKRVRHRLIKGSPAWMFLHGVGLMLELSRITPQLGLWSVCSYFPVSDVRQQVYQQSNCWLMMCHRHIQLAALCYLWTLSTGRNCVLTFSLQMRKQRKNADLEPVGGVCVDVCCPEVCLCVSAVVLLRVSVAVVGMLLCIASVCLSQRYWLKCKLAGCGY